ncbi:MAG: magnesium transporter, partial [Candidatus Ornithospirochaeta sp.]
FREMEEDYLKLASIQDGDSEKGVWASMKTRLPWLMLLLLLGTVVSAAIGSLSSLAVGLTLVFSFQSLLLDMTGNSGTQTLAVAVRALSGRNLSAKDKLRLLRKEFSTGVVSGLILGVCSALLLTPYIKAVSSSAWIYALFLAISIAVALILAMTMANTIGAIVPIAMEKAGVDPAVASGPLITTLNDLVGATAYYTTVCILLRKILGY